MSAGAWPQPPAIASDFVPEEGEKSGLFGSAPIQTAPWPWSFPLEVGVEHFEGISAGQVASPYSVEQLQKAAIHFGSYVLLSPVFFTCSDWDTLPEDEQGACGWDSIERFSQRAWRRPLSEEERIRLKTFWEANFSSSTPDEALVLTAAGILQSPPFVFRAEHGKPEEAQGDAVPLTGWETASRLSYFLWDSMPDSALFEAAAKGELATKEGVETHARRMLEDQRARAMTVHFHHQWLGTDHVKGISPARRVYGPLYGLEPVPPLDTTGDGDWPALLGPIRHSMEAETHLFIERTLFDGAGTLHALLTDNHGYMSSSTLPLYGEDAKVLPGPTISWDFGQVVFSQGSYSSLELYPVELPEEQRAGLLTLPSVLALGAYTVHPAPIIRGKRILERLACQDLGTPVAGAEASLPPDSENAESTNRERTENATSAPVCAVCHTSLNPPGFAFENYDAMGRWRTEDNGLPVDASGTVSLWGGETFTFENGVEFAHQLASSERVHDCYVLRWTRYATGVQFVEGDEGLDALQQSFRKNDNVKELLVRISTSDLFRYRRKDGGQP
jgi:hypothetical protein